MLHHFARCAIALPVLAPPDDAEYAILQQDTSAPKRANPLNIISLYRQYARRCEAAARDAPNEQMRAEHSKMVHVWREFAVEHERIVHEGSDFAALPNQSLSDWILAHRIREAMAPLIAIVMGGEGKVIEVDKPTLAARRRTNTAPSASVVTMLASERKPCAHWSNAVAVFGPSTSSQ